MAEINSVGWHTYHQEQQALSALQNSAGGENPTLQLLGTWIVEAKDELRNVEEIQNEIIRRHEENLFQVELKQKKMRMEGI